MPLSQALQRAPARDVTMGAPPMPAPWSDYAEIVDHIFAVAPQAKPTRSDFLDICYANDIDDDVVDGFDALREGVTYDNRDEVKAALQDLGQISGE